MTVSETILARFGVQGSIGPQSRAHGLALEHLISFHCGSGDIRWSVAALVARSLTAAWVYGQTRLPPLLRNLARRGRACFAPAIDTADTMVAAGGR